MFNHGFRKCTFFLFAYWHDPRWRKFVGATVKIWDLAHNLTQIGHKVVLYLPKYGFSKNRVPFKIVEIPLWDIPFLRKISFNLFLCLYLLSSFFNKRPDVVYMRRMNSIIPALYAKLRSVLLFYEVNDDPFRKAYHKGSKIAFEIRARLAAKLDEINLSLCNILFVISPAIKRKIQERIPALPSDKFRVTPSGANTELFKPLGRNKCRSTLDLDPQKKYVGFIGTLLSHQGIDVLIDAAPLILGKEPQSLFLIIGEGPMKRFWQNRIVKEELENWFIFPGQVDYEEMPVWIGSMNVCVAPFLKTAGLRSPVKLFDYMACGRAVVASSIKGTTDEFLSSGAIKLIPPENPSRLAEAITELLHHSEKADQMGRKGHKLVIENFDRKAIANLISEEAISCKG